MGDELIGVNLHRPSIRSCVAIGAGLALVLSACGGDDDTADTTEPTSDEPATAPAALTLVDQDGDGGSIVVERVELPAPGFIAVHGDADGSPGPVVGVSELLQAGSSTDVVIMLETPLTETGTVFPMVHIDTDGNGVYEFGTVEGVDVPGVTADGDVAVGGLTVTLPTDDADAAGSPATGPASITFEPQESDGTTIAVRRVVLPAAGFIAVHGDGGGTPGAVIGVSSLLPAGTTDDVLVRLDTPIDADTTLFPMVHIDTDSNGVYEFGAVEGVDVPGLTADGGVAVSGADVTFVAGDADAAGDETITIEDFEFGGVSEVAVGTTIVVTNTDAAPHTWTADDGSFDSGALSQGETFEFTFTEVGDFTYHCNFHPSMTGRIVVTG